MSIDFAEEWLNKLKEYWFNKDIENAVSLFTKTTFYQETSFIIHIQRLMKLKRNGNI